LTDKPLDLVVIHLDGGNDALNTLVPFDDPHYHDHRPTIGLRRGDTITLPGLPGSTQPGAPVPAVLPLDDRVGLHGALGLFERMYRDGKLAILRGIGYPDRNRSHFRSLDIWSTANPEAEVTDGWLGRTATALDPKHVSPVLAVNVGSRLPLALSSPGALAASMQSLDSYDMLPGHGPHATAAVRGLYGDHTLPDPWRVAQRFGSSALEGIDLLRAGRDNYRQQTRYPPFSPLASRLQTIARVKAAGVGSRIFWTSHGSYDTHDNQLQTQAGLFQELSAAVEAFLDDLASQDTERGTVILIFSEFGRRVAESLGGTDHGGAGIAFLLGDRVRGGMYGEQPSLHPDDLIDGDLAQSLDFRSLYTSLLDQFVHVDPEQVLPRVLEPLNLHGETA
jgi:uncharacterized protein (DUF1501 family)